MPPAALAQQLDVEFTIIEDGEAAGCGAALIGGLDPNGDGFLAVRTGPGTNFAKIDELYNGDVVRICGGRGQWSGVYYGNPRRKGWIHRNWVVSEAG